MKIFTHYLKTNNPIPKKALIVSDTHIFNEKDCEILDGVLNEVENKQYDYVFLVGDLIDSTNVFYDVYKMSWLPKYYEFYKTLGQIAPTFIVYGSHDFGYLKDGIWLDDKVTFYDRFVNKVSGYTGIKILENETYDLGDGYTVSGYNPTSVWGYNPNRNYTIPEEKRALITKELAFLHKLDPNKFNILMCHYPNIFLDIAEDEIFKSVDLGVAGHTHNGVTQFRIFPLESVLNFLHQNNRGLITAEKSIKPEDTKYLRGRIELNNRASLIVNPAAKTLAACTGTLEKFDALFYKGATELTMSNIEQSDNLKKVRRLK